ncbi:hypothetical protein CASFOL_039501 [Castilleja foliolosa]|uniref:CCHC-type domain-containing protein n=1 Tax=Castilleja foliolosa TaxID=1961234 RepID=A0ABD3BIL7_9LAMI
MLSVSTISANTSNISVLNGNNFKDWKENVLIILGCMDLDLALRIEKPPSLTAASSSDDRRNFEKWERSDRMSLIIIKRGVPEAFRGAISDEVTSAKDFLTEIEKRFAKNDKAETSTLLASLISMKYKGKGNIREYITEMSNTASKLKALKLELSDDLLVHLVLISLPAHFSQFKVSYNCQKEKLTLNELISYCVQEEERLKQDKSESAHFASTSKDKGKKRKWNDAANGPQKKHEEPKEKGCFFCGKPGHQKKDCVKYKAWRAKKYSGATTHISVSMQGCLSYRKPSDDERHIFVGDGKSVEVEAVGHFRLLLRTGFYLDLKDTFVVPSFRRNLVSISLLDKFGYLCSFENNKFSLSLNSNIVGTSSLSTFDNHYLLDTLASYNETLHVQSHGTKRKLNDENSANLWHKRLGLNCYKMYHF